MPDEITPINNEQKPNQGEAEGDTSATQPSSTDQGASSTEKDSFFSPDYRLTKADVERMGLNSWAEGRTFKEYAALNDTIYSQYREFGPQPQNQTGQYQQPVQQPQQFQQQPPQTQTGPQMPDQEMWLNQPDQATQQYGQYLVNTQIDPRLNQLAQQNASTARWQVERDDPEAFKRWGPEIDMYINQMPIEQRNPQVLKTVVDMVRGQHYKEIAEEEAERRVQERLQSGTLMSPTPAGSPTGVSQQNVLDLEDEGVNSSYKDLFKSLGIDANLARQVALKLRIPGQTDEEAIQAYAEKLKKGDVLYEMVQRESGPGQERRLRVGEG